jgi:hypothetical protein
MKKNKTWYERILAYMLKHGYKEITTRYTKYRGFKPTLGNDPSGRLYLLGKGGAVRRLSKIAGKRKSISVTDIFKKYTQLWELEQERQKDEKSV